MAFLAIDNVKIAGVAAGVPKRIVTTASLRPISAEYSNEAYSASTGVWEKRVSDKLTTVDLAVPAAHQLLADLGWEKSEVDALVLVTQTPDYICPCSACILQDKLGLSKECLALDIPLGCSGWVYGLATLSSMMFAGHLHKALLVCGDAKHWHNFPLDPLFGAASTVTALAYQEGECFRFHCGTDGSGWNALYVPEGGARAPFTEASLVPRNFNGQMLAGLQSHMVGMDVFSFGISVPPRSIRKLLAHFAIPSEHIDYYIFHQANKLMIDAIKKKMKLADSQVPLSMDMFGNTSSASIPLTMVTKLGGGRTRDLNVLCCGFGIGLSWGTVFLRLARETVLSKLIEVPDGE